MTSSRVPISIICVFNDPVVRLRCLDRSIEDHREESPRIEYIPIDNVDGSFGSAGAALNHGASLASGNNLVFVHQDVYLHSLRALEEAATHLTIDRGFGLLGAIGLDSDGRVHGRIRDRVILLGEPTATPKGVDSVDEVLFMTPRRLVLQEPLTEAPEMAWHAYAVEYGLRVAKLGLRVGAADVPLTHNSLSTNLHGVEASHAAVAANHPGSLPVRTTCGTITPPIGRTPGSRLLRSQRWRYRWMRESLAIRAARRVARGSPFVLSDIRLDVDEVMRGRVNSPLAVLNLEVGNPPFNDEHSGTLELIRGDEPITLSSGPLPVLLMAVDDRSPNMPMLLTNLRVQDLELLARKLPRERHIIGFHEGIGFWVLIDPATIPAHWRSRRATPLGARSVTP